jgi:hypothetical protein
VNDVIATDREQVTVSAVNHHIHIGIRKPESGCEGNGAAVSGMERVKVQVTCDASGAADAAHDAELAEVCLGVKQSTSEAVYRSANAASWTPDVGHAVCTEKFFYRVRRYSVAKRCG